MGGVRGCGCGAARGAGHRSGRLGRRSYVRRPPSVGRRIGHTHTHTHTCGVLVLADLSAQSTRLFLPRATRPFRATSISTVDTIRKFILRAPLAACPWPSRPSTEPGHRAGHALQRTCRPRAQSARTTRCSMAAAPSPLPRRTKRCQQMLPGTALRMPCTDLHRGGTHGMPLSAANVRNNVSVELREPRAAAGPRPWHRRHGASAAADLHSGPRAVLWGPWRDV